MVSLKTRVITAFILSVCLLPMGILSLPIKGAKTFFQRPQQETLDALLDTTGVGPSALERPRIIHRGISDERYDEEDDGSAQPNPPANPHPVDPSAPDGPDLPSDEGYPTMAIVGVTAAATMVIFYIGVVTVKAIMVAMSEQGRGYLSIDRDEILSEPTHEATKPKPLELPKGTFAEVMGKGIVSIGKGKEKVAKPPGGKPVQYNPPILNRHETRHKAP